MKWTRILFLAFGAFLAGLWLFQFLVMPREPEAAVVGEETSFGFFDPHLHLTVVAARKGEAPDQSLAWTSIYLVTVRARSDAAGMTIDPGRLRIFVRDGLGRDHPPIELSLDGEETTRARLASKLEGGDSYEQTFAFALLEAVEAPVFWISEDFPLSRRLPILEIQPAAPEAGVSTP